MDGPRAEVRHELEVRSLRCHRWAARLSCLGRGPVEPLKCVMKLWLLFHKDHLRDLHMTMGLRKQVINAESCPTNAQVYLSESQRSSDYAAKCKNKRQQMNRLPAESALEQKLLHPSVARFRCGERCINDEGHVFSSHSSRNACIKPLVLMAMFTRYAIRSSAQVRTQAAWQAGM